MTADAALKQEIRDREADLAPDLESQITELGRRARAAATVLARTPAEQKNRALLAAAAAIRSDAGMILRANGRDMEAARARGMTGALLDRLELTPARVEAMAAGLEQIAALPDPVGRTLAEWQQPSGLRIARVSVPLGVIGIIYESRPNVTADAGGLCLKAGNAAILRGGSESFHSSGAILACLQRGLAEAGLPEAAIQRPETTDRAAVGHLLRLHQYLDVIVPRGGRGLIERVMNESRVPVLAHLDGLVHTYLHAAADPEKARAIAVNAKLRRVGICGATETLLVDRTVAARLLPPILADLAAGGCELRGDAAVQALDSRVVPATDADWDTEYLAPILSIRTVEGLDEALAHIARHGSHHTDCIVTEDAAAAERFLAEVDSAIVLHNASTQFADGGEFGMGAEIGIATGRLHARGPVGAEQLTSYKYLVRGSGQTRP
ncbi:glutamate-5-semialdehyde dehydrogenase [Tistlia consotensis]|uniref:Gamma-glutamyl phosphate reductase n=1 Tax=Tistlia consotensis USBA 355 TaxID=560819 RepID=A0A1Y6BFF0_9PROT|nr:glutamate-5-semialdehyde dehydrogenase [Tistlia consotensis]SMF08112.1 glutamate-5-semialdehyde dehydrogenase [Tistlia consotensis USBA 355]SNR35536.1 glutamate-5-semialdehyde dehydrogenase [Tistlia consotensis]